MKDLTPEEQKLVESFRTLTQEMQRIILATLRLMHESEANRNDLPRN